ncbi:MAG TPA: alanine--tRNA ligase [Chloroflexia bacterium]|jgi:alanyl-tRNA synthetase|nr:alanine--tRNA ligase [Chloroflexia bacterium]
MLSSREIRSRFIEFFEQEGHTHVPSSSLVPPGEDTSLLFTNAGMNQFKDVFTGVEQRPYSRAVTVQRCMRAGGKHNDLENVGPSKRHHTFFEMLGNFSFGDYFKRDAISFAWRLFTDVWGLPKDRLWPTVFQDDDDAFNLWQEVAGLPAERITRRGAKDNWWAMGDTGPCGPCSEIFWDFHPELVGQPGHNPEDDEESFIELWNLVFMQFEQVKGGALVPLPRPSIDTGAGLERVTAILQGTDSNYATDIFAPIMAKIREISGQDEAQMQAQIASYRVIADHGRAVTFLIGDGVQPGPSERGYVLRRVLRRAHRHGRLLGIDHPFLGQIAEVVLETMGAYAPEILARRDFILRTIRTEEENFQRTLDAGLSRFEALTAGANEGDVVPGGELFRLYDTFGLPRDLIEELVRDRGLQGDWAGYDAAFRHQQDASRAGAAFAQADRADKEIYQQISPAPTEFLGYDYSALRRPAHVLGIAAKGRRLDSAAAEQEVEVILDRTPFYAEGGGQVGDTGVLEWPGGRMTVRDTRKPVGGVFVHIGVIDEGELHTGQQVEAIVQEGARWDIMRNHTATHLLHKALRDVLGTHVQQAGSLVAPDRLRFDFSHNAPISREDLARIEHIINEQIIRDYPVDWTVIPYQQALASGAMALFNEKYGNEVRVVHIPGFESRELCGGTHVERTGQIGSCFITGEASIGSGVRRIECVTGRGAVAWVEGRNALLAQVAAAAQAQPERLVPQVVALQDQLKAAQKRISALERQIASGAAGMRGEQVQEVKGVRVLTARTDAASAESLRDAADHLRDKLQSGVVVLGTVIDGKPSLVAMATADAVGRGANAGQLVKQVAAVVGGGGGGRPELGQAGGRDATKLDDALATVPEFLARQLNGA